MKYTTVVEIHKPLEDVIHLFDNPDNLKHWMEGLHSFEHLSGIAGQPGAKSRLVFKMGKREMELIETILVRNLPHEFSGTYEGAGVVNSVSNKFEAVDEHTTRYSAVHEFHFNGLMKLMAWLFPGSFKKQSLKYLNSFKEFAENN